MLYELCLDSKRWRGKTQYAYKKPFMAIDMKSAALIEQCDIKYQMCFTPTFYLRFIFGYNLLVFSEFRRRRHDVSLKRWALKGRPRTEANTTSTSTSTRARLFPRSLSNSTISNKAVRKAVSWREDETIIGSYRSSSSPHYELRTRFPPAVLFSKCAFENRERNGTDFHSLPSTQGDDDDDVMIRSKS